MVDLKSTTSAMPLIVAHRGASNDAPENTLAAFRLAWQQVADGIEADFRLTSDNRVVCIHDGDLQRLAGVPVVVREASFDELRTYDVGRWKGETWRGEKIPALEEVLAVVPARKKLFIELKTGLEIVAPTADAIERSSLAAAQLLLMAFDADTAAACKARLPNVTCHWLTRYAQQEDGTWMPTPDDVVATIRRSGADGLGSKAEPDVFNEDFVRRLRAAGIGDFHVWTVDDPDLARFYTRLGAGALTTNRPGSLRTELSA